MIRFESIGETRTLQKVYMWSVMLLPLLSIYASPIPSVSIGEIWFFCLMFILSIDMFKMNYKVQINPFYCYILYALFVSVLSSVIFSINTEYSSLDMIERMFRDAFYFAIVLIFGVNYFKFSYALTVVRKVALLLSLYMIIQYIAYAGLNINLPNIIPFLDTMVSGGVKGQEILDQYEKTAIYDGYMRVAGFFSEPAVSAQFLSVAILLELYCVYGTKPEYKYLCLYTIAMILTFSVNAYVALVVCWGIWLFFNKQFKMGIWGNIVVFFFVVLGSYFLVTNEFTQSVFNRLLLLGDSSITTGSSVIRVVRGPAFYLSMPLFYQIFGSGFGNFFYLKNTYNISTIYETNDDYMNTNSYIMISAGLIGFLIYILSLYMISRHKLPVSRMILLIVIVFGFSSSIYSTPQFIIMLLFILYGPQKL